MAPSHEICAHLFKIKDQGIFLCQLYSNLMPHLLSTHPGFEETYNNSVTKESSLTNFGFVSEAKQQIFQ
ncbi:hypothetical protein PHMEG_00023220 [Phytophthora megakarya]|uniref:Uncharacterized protein n=1 Tax=Phytophthora megakarya TaxID=4795 RepID=A0A225VIL9_9STRA|nr:hypothetical protein PHMEG_00023220 [Phytophthora megakarya]